MNHKYQHILSFYTTARHSAICVKTQDVLVFMVHAGIYDALMLVFAIHAGIYDSCLYLRFMLVFTTHDAGIYDSCWFLRFMLVFTIHVGIYGSCWYLRFMLHGVYGSCWYLHFMLVFTIPACVVNISMNRKYQHES